MAKNTSKKKISKKKKNQKTKSTNPDYRKWWFALSVFVFAVILNFNTRNHDFVLDDDLVCKKNSFVQEGVSSLPDIFTHSWYYGFLKQPDRYYRPMMLAGFAVETSAFGTEANVYHKMNIFYYALGCGLLFLILQSLFRDKPLWFPLAITLLFTAHPLHTEVVANIKSRDEIFAFLGFIGVVYGLIKYHRKSNVGFFILALVSYFFAILSKEAALSLLGIVPLVLYFFTDNSSKKIVVQTLSFGIIAAIYFAIRMGIIDPDPNAFETIDNSLFAIEGRGSQLSTAIGMLGKYLGLLFFPHPLSYDYSFNQIPMMSWGNWKVLTSLLAYGGLIFLAIKGLKTKHPISFGIFFFGITFAITSNVVFLIGATFAERFMFLPLLGFCIIITYLIYEYFPKIFKNAQQPTYAVLVVIVLLYSFKTITRNQVWESDDTLFESGIVTAPNSSRAQSFYGVMNYRRAITTEDANEKKQFLAEAVTYLQKSIDTYPGFTETYQHLGIAYEAQNNNTLAIQTYQKGLETNSTYYQAMTNMGVLYYKMKNYNQAILQLNNALNFSPNNPVIHRALGLTYKDTQQFDLAANHFKQALAAQKNVTHLFDLVELYKAMGDFETAIFYDKQIKELRGE